MVLKYRNFLVNPMWTIFIDFNLNCSELCSMVLHVFHADLGIPFVSEDLILKICKLLGKTNNWSQWTVAISKTQQHRHLIIRWVMNKRGNSICPCVCSSILGLWNVPQSIIFGLFWWMWLFLVHSVLLSSIYDLFKF